MSSLNPNSNYEPEYNVYGISIDGRRGKYPNQIMVSENLVRDWA